MEYDSQQKHIVNYNNYCKSKGINLCGVSKLPFEPRAGKLSEFVKFIWSEGRMKFTPKKSLEVVTTDKGNKIDGVGSRNSGNSIGRPLPQYKLNANLRWMYDIHSLVATVRYVDDYEDDTAQSPLRASFGFLAPTIDSHTELDMQYSLQIPETSLLGGSSVFVFGVKNLTNEEPPIVNVDGGYDYFTHDPRGRIVYSRLTWSI